MKVLTASVAVNVSGIAADKRYSYTIPQPLRGQIAPGMRVLVPFGRGNARLEAIVLSVQETEVERNLKCIQAALDAKPVLDEELLRLAVHLRNRVFCPLYTIVRAMLPAGYWFRVESEFRPAEGATLEEALAASVLIPDSEDAVRKIFSADGGGGRGATSLKRLRNLMPDVSLKALVSTLINRGILVSDETVRTRATEKLTRLYSLAPEAEEVPLRSVQQKEVVRFLRQTDRASAKEIAYYTGVGSPVVQNLVKKGLVCCESVETSLLEQSAPFDPQPIILNEEQTAAEKGLEELFCECRYATALLRGVTGSGKTMVYMKLIEKVLSDGESVILLVPEIALTPQLAERFCRQFGSTVAVLHSALSVGDRYDSWQKIRSGKCRLVIGTRSAVFAPVVNLGLIIIDEEHEHTYKSEQAPRYHAREAAQYRCFRKDTLLVLGSATPSVSSAYYAETGVYKSFVLKNRYGQAQLPETVVADLRTEYRRGYTGTMGYELLNRLQETYERGEQAILFLNRRGSARELICMECGEPIRCRNCSVSLSYHAASGRLMCHQCGYSVRRPDICPSCHRAALAERGFGTQAVERELSERFPQLRVLRMDSDTTGGSHTHADILDAFRRGEADVLVGTQMVAKGLDFENVTLSGIIDADISLYGSDYTCAEETFALITQVAGRSGRGSRPGTAVIQTAAPRSDVVMAAAAQDYERFYSGEIAVRRALRQPPFVTLEQFFLSGREDDAVYNAAVRLREIARLTLERCRMEGDILGPAAAAIHKLNNRYRYTLTVRCADAQNIRAFTGETLRLFSADPQSRRISIYADTL